MSPLKGAVDTIASMMYAMLRTEIAVNEQPEAKNEFEVIPGGQRKFQ